MFQQLPDVYPVRINLMNIGVNKYTAWKHVSTLQYIASILKNKCSSST